MDLISTILFFVVVAILADVLECNNPSVVCDGDSMILECSNNTTLTIEEANFGREEPDVCITDRRIESTCKSSFALKILKSRCDGKQACNAMVSDSTFGTNCNAEKPYLDVRYFCKTDILPSTPRDVTIDKTTPNSIVITSEAFNWPATEQINSLRPIESSKSLSTESDLSSSIPVEGTTSTKRTVNISRQTPPPHSTSTTSDITTDITKKEGLSISTRSRDLLYDASYKVCTCACNIHKVLNNHDLLQSVPTNSIKDKIVINKEALSSTKRKLTSATDKRMSAAVVGYVAILAIVVIILIILVSDIATYLIGPRKVMKKAE